MERERVVGKGRAITMKKIPAWCVWVVTVLAFTAVLSVPLFSNDDNVVRVAFVVLLTIMFFARWYSRKRNRDEI